MPASYYTAGIFIFKETLFLRIKGLHTFDSMKPGHICFQADLMICRNLSYSAAAASALG